VLSWSQVFANGVRLVWGRFRHPAPGAGMMGDRLHEDP